MLSRLERGVGKEIVQRVKRDTVLGCRTRLRLDSRFILGSDPSEFVGVKRGSGIVQLVQVFDAISGVAFAFVMGLQAAAVDHYLYHIRQRQADAVSAQPLNQTD